MVEHRDATPAERERRLARASLRAARVVADMHRETKFSDTRLLDWLIPSELVVVGRSHAFDQDRRLDDASIDWTETSLAAEGARPSHADMISSRPETLMADDLYEQDFYLWTQAQAEALRSHGASNVIDWETVAEEVEDMGKQELRATESLLVRIIEHLHKLRSAKRDEPRLHWRKEILAFRFQLEQRMTPSIRAKLEADLDRLHHRGAKEADRWMFHDDVDFHPIDYERRWNLAELLGEADDPLPKLWNMKVQN